MQYTKIFNPDNNEVFTEMLSDTKNLGDRRNKSYVFDEKIILAVNVALATGRPILVQGPSGWGKSSLAKSVAAKLDWEYHEKVISSRLQARDLLWEVDHLFRLQDAQNNKLKDDFTNYIKPGVLWWAFNYNEAQKQEEIFFSSRGVTRSNDENRVCDHSRAVVLLDEIDKADPDLPNNLLVPLGSLYFTVEETGKKIECENTPLVFITTNNERDLPPAFLRRCVDLKLEPPDLMMVGKAHFEEKHIELVTKIASILDINSFDKNETQSSTQTSKTNKSVISNKQSLIQYSGPSPAEFIDTVNACIKLKISPESDDWNKLVEIIVWKHGRRERGKL